MIELDRHIEILLLSNDCVIIPNFGGFMAHYVEARKDDRDSAFLPPMRTIGFNPKLKLNDSLLAQSYVEAYDISYPDAVARIEDEVRELKQHLENDDEYELKDIGLLRLTDAGSLEFEPCDAGILTPSLYGLGYYNFKTLAQIEQETAEKELQQVPATVAELKPMVQPAIDETMEMSDDDVEEPAHNGHWTALWRNIAVACAAFIVFLLIPTPLSNNHSKLIESRVNTQLLDYVVPKQDFKGENAVKEVARTVARPAAAPVAQPTQKTATPQAKSGYTIVLASKVSHKNATAYVEDLHRRGFEKAGMLTKNRNNKVVFGQYASEAEAYKAISKLRQDKEFGEAWIMKY